MPTLLETRSLHTPPNFADPSLLRQFPIASLSPSPRPLFLSLSLNLSIYLPQRRLFFSIFLKNLRKALDIDLQTTQSNLLLNENSAFFLI